MPETLWQQRPELATDEALSDRVREVHQALLEGPLAGDPSLNLALPIEIRALRRLQEWRALLLLTPWMLSRLLFPDRPPDLEIPPGWSAAARAGAEYAVLGPGMRLSLLGQAQQAHLHYHPALGHYLLQPLCLDMEPYAEAAAVFEAWNAVLRRRDQRLAQSARDCPLQREISRRELFRRLSGPARKS